VVFIYYGEGVAQLAAREAYETDVSLDQLRSGPSELNGEAFDWGDRSPIYPNWIL